jgi:hypothetical protein
MSAEREELLRFFEAAAAPLGECSSVDTVEQLANSRDVVVVEKSEAKKSRDRFARYRRSVLRVQGENKSREQ